jgi:hypothetical protein
MNIFGVPKYTVNKAHLPDSDSGSSDSGYPPGAAADADTVSAAPGGSVCDP